MCRGIMAGVLDEIAVFAGRRPVRQRAWHGQGFGTKGLAVDRQTGDHNKWGSSGCELRALSRPNSTRAQHPSDHASIIMIHSRCFEQSLYKGVFAAHPRTAEVAPAHHAKPRHHRLSSDSEQQSAARSACTRRATAVEAPGASSAAPALDVEPPADGPTARLVAVVPAEGSSHFGIPWTRVMSQMARRLSWVDPAFQLQVCS